MKHYLELVPIFAKVHRRQNRMSVLCILLSVFLVTAIFGMADMFIQAQQLQARQEDGDWHILLREISDEDAALMAMRSDVEVIAPYSALNYKLDQGYFLSGKDVCLIGIEGNFLSVYPQAQISQGTFPDAAGEALVTENARKALNLQLGDAITVDCPDGARTFHLSGFLEDVPGTLRYDAYLVALGMQDYRALYPGVTHGDAPDYNTAFYLRFSSTRDIPNAIQDLKDDFGLRDDQVSENTKLLGLLGQSRDSFMMKIYTSAGVLVVLVLWAGVLMIAGSLNSSVAQRTEFFGLLRCLGATPQQVMRLVRREALGWCRLAIPAGVGCGMAVIWLLCVALRFLSPNFFGTLPVFGVSLPSILAGVLVGLLTVLLAARAPARRAAKVSPLAAVSGEAGAERPVRRAANTRRWKVDTALGIHHATASRKNYLLMTGSFALSILLFLSFSVTVDFMGHAVTPLRPWAADLSVISPDNTCSVDPVLLKKVQAEPAVERVYGRMFAYDLPVLSEGFAARTVNLISYEEQQFRWAEEFLVSGSLERVQEEVGTVLVVGSEDTAPQVGEQLVLELDGRPVTTEVAGCVSYAPFHQSDGTGTVLCSEETFRQLTGAQGYTILDIQLRSGTTQAQVDALHQLAGDGYTFSDSRMGNSSARGAYYSFALLVYGFLLLIALITVFNVVNSLAMSVAARTRQYGTFLAIGLSQRQLRRMVSAEAGSYVLSGAAAGTVLGLVLNRFLFQQLISFRWGETWRIPWGALGLILLLLAVSVALAVYGPLKRLRKLSVVETLDAQ